MKKIIVKGINYKKLDNSMPTPSRYDGKNFGGMSIIDEDGDLMNSFLDGSSFEVYTACEDECMIKYGGDVILTYFVDKNSMEEYEATIEDYIEFIVYLKKKFPKADIKVLGLTKKDKKLLILENLK